MKKLLRRLLAAVCSLLLLLGSASALTLEQAVRLLEEYYVDDLPAEAYEAETIDELFQALGDPYSYYMDEEDYHAFIESVEGVSRVGIGVSITYAETGIVINSIIPGGAAEELGLVEGDTITAVDGVSCVPAQESDVARIAGPEGTAVSLTILHENGTSETIRAVRRPFTVPTISAQLLENGSVLIDCDSFATDTGAAFCDIVTEYGEEAGLWLVDLRSNGGGLADSAVAAAGVFTGPGFLLYFRDGEGNYSPSLHFDEALTGVPAVVLTNGYTASASEIFASAIKDFGAGIVVGERTYGKGVAQILLDHDARPVLFDGDAMKITAYRFYTGTANTTDCVGVLPTLLVRNELAGGVAMLLRGSAPDAPEGWLRLTLGGRQFYVNAADARETEEGCESLAELFSALAPDVDLALCVEGRWLNLTAPLAAAYLKVEYSSRWFADAAESDYGGELNALAAYGLLEGDGKGSFRPQNTLTRAELCALVCQTLDRKSLAASPFSDVSDDSWYAPYVTELYQLGLVEGNDGSFGPGEQVSVQEFITILGRLAAFLNTNCRDLVDGLTEEELSGDTLDAFADWARPGAWLLGGGYAQRVLDGADAPMLFAGLEELDPVAPILRGEAGASLYHTLTVLGVLAY